MASGGGETTATGPPNENGNNNSSSDSTNCNINALIASGGSGATSSNFNGNGCVGSAAAGNNEADNLYIVDANTALALRRMQTFHPRCGRRITLSNGNRTAMRSVRDFSHALVFSAELLVDNVLFEVMIERKNNCWGGSIEIGVTHEPPDELELLSSATAMRNGTWVISGTEVRCNGECINGHYGVDLETLMESDRVGIMRTHKNELVVYVNGESMGVADYHVPKSLWALVNLYGRCVQVSICPYVDMEGGSGDMNESTQQQIVQSIDLPLSVDVSVTSSAGGNISTTSLVDAANSANLSLVNALAVARNLCSSLPPPLLFPRQQNNSNTNQTISGIGAPSAVSSVVSAQNPSDFYDMNERLRFHTRCGSLVKLSTNFRSAERRRPLDEFNNGVVMTHRPLKDNELFEIRIDKLVDKWSGSIEVGVTTHNPTVLHFPATMTNMRSGTIMMSGCGILTNGKGTRRQYGEFNLDELAEGDRVGMMRKANSNLHYYINGQDQGVAATRVASTLWGVIDLYGMTIKVTIVDRDEREQQNLVTRRNNLLLSTAAAAAAAAACATTTALSMPVTSSLTPMLSLQSPESEGQVNGIIGGGGDSVSALNGAIAVASMNSSNVPRNDDRLTFNPLCGSHARVTHNGRTALRPNASDDFNNGVVLTRRPLRPNELFQVRLERVVSKWAGSVEMGVTIYSAEELDFPFTMTNVRTGTWMMTGNGVMQNGITVIEQYGQNLDRLQVGDRVGVMRKDDGSLHFWVNGLDQGVAAIGVPERVYGVIDLYGKAAQASIVDTSECGSPDTGNSTISNTSLYSEPPLRFHLIHGKNANISSNGLTASRPNSLAEFNDSIVFSNRPLRQRELFEVVLENMVRHWSGNVEIGVTGTRPEDITLSPNATDLEAPETIILCGSMLFYNRKTIRSNVPMDLDFLSVNARVGVMRNGDFIHFYINGVDQGPACELRSPNIWAIVDLYGQCAQVSLTQTQPVEIPRVAPYATSENSQSCQATSVIQPAALETKHRWTCVSGLVQLSQNWTVASRFSGTTAALMRCLVFSEHPLRLGSPFEIRILVRNPMLAGSLSIGITDLNLSDDYVRRNLPVNIKRIPANVWYLTGNELRHNMRLLQRSATSLEWLRAGDRISLELTTGRTLRVLFNSEDMNIHFKHVAKNPYVVVELHGSTMAVQAISSQAPMSPLRPCILRLQDSLDFGADPLNKQDSMLESMESEVVSLEFLDHFGSNLRLQNDNRTATRIASFNNGVIFGNKAMCKGDCISVKVDKVNSKWQGTIGVGVVGFSPLLLDTIPQSLLHLSRRCWGITKDYISINGQRISSNYGEPLDHIQAGTVITLTFTFSNMLIITVGGTTLEEVGTLPNYVYPVFDLYGKCEQITAVVMPSSETVALNNGVSPPMASAPSVETAITTIAVSAGSTTETAPTAVEASNVGMHTAEDDLMSSLDNDPEHNLSREKADLECHEKETNENIEQPGAIAQEEVENDDDDNELTSLHASPANTNLNASMNRSVMESVSENLLTNLSIKIRSLELQNRQSEVNGSTSNLPSCRLRESLQLHHNTNYNIQRSQSNQRLQQQQAPQNALTAVHDTNKDYDALESDNAAGNLAIFEDNSVLQNSGDSNTISSLNSARNRVTTAFGAFLANEIMNDSSSTSNSSICRDRISSATNDNVNIAEREFINVVDAALNDNTSSSSNISVRDRPVTVRSGNSMGLSDISIGNLVDSLSLTSTDSSIANLGVQNRILGGPLRINDFLLESSDGGGSNEAENRQQQRPDTNDISDDGFVTIMGLNSQWRPQSPILEECLATAQEEIAQLDSARFPCNGRTPNVLRNVVRSSAVPDGGKNNLRTQETNGTTGNANFIQNSGTSYDSLQSLSTLERRDCAYLKLVKQFFASLVLPQVFFSRTSEILCFCSNCNISGRTGLNDWVYYKLDTRTANAHEPPSSITEYDQYFCMYFVTRVDKIRAILDFGQLVPQESAREGELHTPPSASAQKDEPGTRLELHFSPENKEAMKKNGHLRFSHNGKQYRIGAAFEVFVRHQALCSLPSNKLGECSSNRSDLHSLPSVPSCSGSGTSLFNGVLLGGGGTNVSLSFGDGGRLNTNVISGNNNAVDITSRNSAGRSGSVNESTPGSGTSRSNGSVRSGSNSVNDSGGSVPSFSNSGSGVLPMSSTNSNTSFTELTWFTKEDGSCFINALVLRLEELTGDGMSIDNLLGEVN